MSRPGGDGVSEQDGDAASGPIGDGGAGTDIHGMDTPGGDGGAGTGPSGAVLAPLRARYASWLGLDRDQVLVDRDEDPAEIRALQVILRLERDRQPSWYRALELTAQGCAALCLDPRAEPGGEWYGALRDYCSGHIRKVTRRARAGQWDATADLPGITLTDGDTQLRTLLPGRVSEVDKRVSRLQVGGTDAPRQEPEPAAAPALGTLLITPAPGVPMTLGKAMAQAGHAGMIAAALLAGDQPAELARWYADGLPVAARPVDAGRWAELSGELRDPAAAWRQRRLLAVRDAGFTEIEPGTITVIAAIAPPDPR